MCTYISAYIPAAITVLLNSYTYVYIYLYVHIHIRLDIHRQHTLSCCPARLQNSAVTHLEFHDMLHDDY